MSKKKEEDLKNSFRGCKDSANQDGSEPESLSGNDFQVDYCKYSQSKSYENFRAGGQNGRQNDVRNNAQTGSSKLFAPVESKSETDKMSSNSSAGYSNADRSSFSPKSIVKMTDGGSCRVPSVAETRAYLDALVESRKHACAPIDFEPWRAERWYKSLNPLLKTSVMAKKVKAKFGFED